VTAPPLAEAAAKVLRELGYDNVSVKIGDGAPQQAYGGKGEPHLHPPFRAALPMHKA
jgi:hypothetical protein